MKLEPVGSLLLLLLLVLLGSLPVPEERVLLETPLELVRRAEPSDPELELARQVVPHTT